MADFLKTLVACYGQERVVDVFAGTGIAQEARNLNMGCYVVRRVLTSEQQLEWHQDLSNAMTSIAEVCGPRQVDLKGNRTGPLAYRTIQCASGRCICKYEYAGTARHRLWRVSDWKHFQDACDWLHNEHNVDWPDRFDALVANVYSRSQNQCVNEHTDQSELLGATSSIVSVSLGAAGVFYWRPSPNGTLRRRISDASQSRWRWWRNLLYHRHRLCRQYQCPHRCRGRRVVPPRWVYKKEKKRHEAEQILGYWGCTPLLPGDLMLCSGRFQHELIHGSLTYHEAAHVEEVLSKYELCPNALKVLRSEAYQRYFDSSWPQLDRSVITFRKIENHYPQCPEGDLPFRVVGPGGGAETEERGDNSGAHSELPQSEFADTQNVRAPPQGLEIDVGGARRGPPGVRE